MTPVRRREQIRITNAVPVLFVILVVCLIAGLTSGTVRDQFSQSFTRQPERYIALLFSDEMQSRSCEISEGKQEIDVTLYSQLANSTDIDWVVSVTKTGPEATGTRGEATDRRTGTVNAIAGRSSAIRTEVTVPASGPYRVNVDLTGRAERLILQCRTSSSAP